MINSTAWVAAVDLPSLSWEHTNGLDWSVRELLVVYYSMRETARYVTFFLLYENLSTLGLRIFTAPDLSLELHIQIHSDY